MVDWQNVPTEPSTALQAASASLTTVWVTLLTAVQDDVLLAYQLCFDLFENESQAFNLMVHSHPLIPSISMGLMLLKYVLRSPLMDAETQCTTDSLAYPHALSSGY